MILRMGSTLNWENVYLIENLTILDCVRGELESESTKVLKQYQVVNPATRGSGVD